MNDFRPLSSVPSYIVEESLSSVPTTSKTVYNVTKIDPSFYNVYDGNQEIYRNRGKYQSISTGPMSFCS